MDMVGKDKWRVNNLHDRKWSPRPAQNIVKEALSWTDKDVKYSIDSWNCEHFATRLRYDRSMPTQVCKSIHSVELATGEKTLLFYLLYNN